jgi:class 3 adenylate cyclase/tetratricopeptide (TPR) repeat protein
MVRETRQTRAPAIAYLGYRDVEKEISSWFTERFDTLDLKDAKHCSTNYPIEQSEQNMRCQKCGTDNPRVSKFCAECGDGLAHPCPACGTENSPPAKFCSQCGASLDLEALALEPSARERASAGERRHLTILFCDLVGSVTLTSQFDPEEWRATVAGYQRAASEAITRFGGEVMRYVGDGIMAFFGYPVAHDNDAERAARAGLAILDALVKLNQEPGHTKLSVRVGIDSGPVVVGTGASQAVDAFGDAANIAARVQSTAEADTLVVTGATHRLISGLFVVEDRGAQALKGIQRSVQLYRIIRPSGVRTRFEATAAAGGLTPFVGREDELRSLLMRWERAREGNGQVVVIIGEAGIGKSRLVRRFHEQLVGTPHTWLEAGAGAFFLNTPFYSISETLRQFTVEDRDPIANLVRRLEAAGLAPAKAIPLLAPLLNLPLPPEYPPSSLPPEQQRRRLLATLVEWMLGSARRQPLVSVIEDLHWADPSTLELIQLLVEQGATAPLLLLYTARPEFRVPWPLRAHHTQINLNRLSAREVHTMIGEVAARKALSDESVATVVKRTGGVPLFVEELTRAVLESGDGKLNGRAIPVTLHDSLMARLDRLESAKEVAQVSAVLGSEFSYDLLYAVHPIPESELQQALRSLTDAELLYVRGIAPEATYQFKHVLIRDAAYEALLKSRRKEVHLTVARTIDEHFPLIKEAHPEVLAYHWTEAEQIELAVTQWSRAGRTAESRNAFKEALESYQQAILLITQSQESAERDGQELELRLSVASMAYVTKGWAAPERFEAIAHALPLAEKSENLIQLVQLLRSSCVSVFISGDLVGARALADQTLDLASREGSPASLAAAHELQVITRHWRGDFLGAEEHFAKGLAFVNAPDFKQALGAGVPYFGTGGWNAWMLGRSDVARDRIEQMMEYSNVNNPWDLAFAGIFAAHLRIYLRQYEQAEAQSIEGLKQSERNQFQYLTEVFRLALGLARAQLGRADEGVELIAQSKAGLVEIASRLGFTREAAYLAEAQAYAGKITHALETIDQLLEVDGDELLYRPEALRLRGELRLKQGDSDLAESDFRGAVALAQSMSAKAWELRATTSLARLLASHGRRDEARVMLAEIHGWFTEGFDTADLKEAKTLLDKLSP